MRDFALSQRGIVRDPHRPESRPRRYRVAPDHPCSRAGLLRPSGAPLVCWRPGLHYSDTGGSMAARASSVPHNAPAAEKLADAKREQAPR
jgi:hypothetical protein